MVYSPRREKDFAAWVTERSDYEFVVSGWDSRTFTIVTTDTDRVACDGFVTGILHDKVQDPVRAALIHEGFKDISCGLVTATLPIRTDAEKWKSCGCIRNQARKNCCVFQETTRNFMGTLRIPQVYSGEGADNVI